MKTIYWWLWGICLVGVIVYFLYLFLGAFFILKALEANILPTLIERNEELAKIAKFLTIK